MDARSGENWASGTPARRAIIGNPAQGVNSKDQG
jgi:hypothetical protein